MTGFAAIAHYNGWMMAALGAAIVFSGLAALSFVISLLPKIFALFEKIGSALAAAPAPAEADRTPRPMTKAATPETVAQGIAAQIEPLAASLQAPFQLAALYRLCRERNIPHPHLSLSDLQRRGILHPEGGGAFTWKSEGETAQEG